MGLKQEFSKKLKELRKQRKLTQEQLAEIVHVDFRHISYLETARSFPSCDLLERLCKALNVSFCELFDFNKEISREELITNLTELMNRLDNKKLNSLYKIAQYL